jgi:hypothetical protein
MLKHARRCVFLALVAGLLGPLGARAATLDPEKAARYPLKVVLHIGGQRLLTPVFKDTVERELRDSLEAALGDLATVEVVREHPRLQEVLDTGLDKALDNWKDVTNVKTHFVLIDFVDGQYEVQTRQHDGFTGQASPVVRREHTPDRQFVARTATLLVGRDFGLVGTVIEEVNPQTLKVAFRGGGLGLPLDRWVQKDEVMLIVQVSGSPGAMRATREPWAVLRVQDEPKDGVCTCQLFHRHKKKLDTGPGILGYRCLKISTIKAPLRLRLVKAKARALTPESGRQIHVRRLGFGGEDNSKIQGATDADGYFATEKEKEKGEYDNVAFVSILIGNTPKAQIPIPLVDQRVVSVPVDLSTDGDLQITVRRDLWVQQVYESLVVLAALFRDLEASASKPGEQDATLKKAQAGYQGVKEAVDRFLQQREAMVQDAKGQPLELAEGDQRLKELQAGQAKLQSFVAKLEQIATAKNDPKRKALEAQILQGEQLEGDAEVGRAIDLYEQLLKKGDLDESTKKQLGERIGQLKEAWKAKSVKHQTARNFIYDTWPTIEPLKLKPRLKEARDAFDACREVSDLLGPQKLIRATVPHVAKLKELLGSLMPDVNEDDRNTAKQIVEVSEGLNALIKDVSAYLEKAPK